MKFPQVQAIIYITRSIHNSENTDVVKKAMEMNQEERSKQTSFFELTPALPQLAQSLRESARISNGLVENDIALTRKGELCLLLEGKTWFSSGGKNPEFQLSHTIKEININTLGKVCHLIFDLFL